MTDTYINVIPLRDPRSVLLLLKSQRRHHKYVVGVEEIRDDYSSDGIYMGHNLYSVRPEVIADMIAQKLLEKDSEYNRKIWEPSLDFSCYILSALGRKMLEEIEMPAAA